MITLKNNRTEEIEEEAVTAEQINTDVEWASVSVYGEEIDQPHRMVKTPLSRDWQKGCTEWIDPPCSTR
jgi:hypothetical protein